MTRILFFLIAAISLVCGFGLLFLNAGTPALAQGDIDFVGADECASCHRGVARSHRDSLHVLTLQKGDDGILADFDQGEDARMVAFPDEDAPRAFTEDDIAYTVGTGRYVQRYLYEVGRREYRVLPAEWDTVNQTWRPLALADSWDDPAYDWGQSCASCHTTGFEPERGRWKDDGVQCESCHGPGEDHAKLASRAGRRPNEEELSEIRAAINPAIDPQTCGQCHSRGVGPDNQPFPAGYLPGGDLTAHFTLAAPDQADHWWATGHASQMNMQYNEWALSGHANALSDLRESDAADASCLSCHSADYAYSRRLAAVVEAGDREGETPALPDLETAQFGVTCTSCHNPHADNELPADLVEEPYALCASCHSNAGVEAGVHHPAREMFEGTALIGEITPVAGVHFITENGPTCVSCHAMSVPVDGGIRASHALTPILPGAALDEPTLNDACSDCHEAEAEPQLLQRLIDDIQANTRMRIDTARAAVNDNTPEWVILALDFVEGDGSLGIHNYAYSDAALDAVYEALGLNPTPEQ